MGNGREALQLTHALTEWQQLHGRRFSLFRGINQQGGNQAALPGEQHTAWLVLWHS
jgi:hypothetical protein